MKQRQRVVLTLTPSQAKCVNAALALYESEDHEYEDDFRRDVLHRTRLATWAAMEAAGVSPV